MDSLYSAARKFGVASLPQPTRRTLYAAGWSENLPGWIPTTLNLQKKSTLNNLPAVMVGPCTPGRGLGKCWYKQAPCHQLPVFPNVRRGKGEKKKKAIVSLFA